MKQAEDRNEKILKKHMEENQRLKKQLASGGGGGGAGAGAAGGKAPSVGASAGPRKDFKSMRAARKENATKTIEEFNQKFLTDLQGQIDDMFTNAAQKKLDRQKSEVGETSAAPDGEVAKAEDEENKDENDQEEVAEKAKILAGVRQYAISMSSDIKDLLKNEWAGTIQSLEGEKKKAESDRKESLLKAKNDATAVQTIEKEHQAKMLSLNNQV